MLLQKKETFWNILQVFMLFVTAGLLGFNLYGVIHLEQDFDPNWFIPSDSYAKDYIKASEKYFPGDGVPVTLYVGKERNLQHKASWKVLI